MNFFNSVGNDLQHLGNQISGGVQSAGSSISSVMETEKKAIVQTAGPIAGQLNSPNISSTLTTMIPSQYTGRSPTTYTPTLGSSSTTSSPTTSALPLSIPSSSHPSTIQAKNSFGPQVSIIPSGTHHHRKQ